MNKQKTCGKCRYYRNIEKHYLFSNVDKGYCLNNDLARIDLYPDSKACRRFRAKGGIR